MNNLKPYTKYKPSNIAWLGDIPEHWEMRKLKYVANFQSGEMITSETISPEDGEYPVYGGGGFRGYTNNYTNDGSHILIGRQGALCGNIKYTNGKFWASEHSIVTYPKIKVENIYLGEILTICNLGKLSQTAAQPGIAIGQIKNVSVSIPPFEEQQAIANFLDYKLSKIDRFIQKKKQLIKLLNEQKAGIINDAVTKGLNPNAKMKPSNIEWLGDIPEHWEVRKLKYGVNYFKGFAFKSIDYSSNGIPIVKASNLKDTIIKNIDSYIDFTNERPEFESVRLKVNDVILSTVGSKPEIINSAVGQIAFVEDTFEGAYLNQNTVCLRPTNANLAPSFLKLFFLSKYFRQVLDSKSLAIANQAYLQVDSILNIYIVVPTKEEQKSIVQHIEQETAQINAVIQTIEKEIALTQEYRVTLIAEAVTGKIDVRAYEIPETPVMELYEELEDEMSLAAEEEVGYSTEN